MVTKIDLCSMALLKLGESPIQSFSDDSASAKLSRTLFDVVIDTLISSYPWRFATCDMELIKNTDGDFIIPSNVLRIIKSRGKILGNKISAIGDKTTIIALVRTSPEYFPSYFVSLAATRLAMEFCMPLIGDSSIYRMLVALYETELQSAKFIDSTSCTSESISNFSLLNVRY